VNPGAGPPAARTHARPWRVGLIVPSSNVTMETELPELLASGTANGNAVNGSPAHGGAASGGTRYTFHSSRAVLHRVDAESLHRMVGESDRCAREIADAQVDAVAYACLIAVMAEGAGAHEAAEARLAATLAEAGCAVPVTSSAGALVRTLQRLGATRVAMITPYVETLTQLVAGYLEGYGITVVSSVSLGVADNVAVGRLDPGELAGHARRLELHRADAVILSACVQMPSLPALAAARAELGRPVLSAATATATELASLLATSARR
jgi:maleate isomerase